MMITKQAKSFLFICGLIWAALFQGLLAQGDALKNLNLLKQQEAQQITFQQQLKAFEQEQNQLSQEIFLLKGETNKLRKFFQEKRNNLTQTKMVETKRKSERKNIIKKVDLILEQEIEKMQIKAQQDSPTPRILDVLILIGAFFLAWKIYKESRF